MKIKDIVLKNNFLLAPLAGITDVGFRKIAKDYGAGLTYTEMVSVKGLIYDNKNSAALLETAVNEDIKAVQLFGNEPLIFREVIERGYLDKFDIIDINMGCPVKKVYGAGSGCFLMANDRVAEDIIKACVSATNKPITVKFRSGIDERNVNASEFAKMAEGAGASLVTVHGRTREQMYSGIADLKVISDVVSAVDIPVVGNGDVNNLISAKKMISQTGCDGVMIARGALGRPYIFSELLEKHLKIDKASVIKEHFELFEHATSLHYAVINMRKHLSWYLKGIRNGASIRNNINYLNTKEEIFKVLDEIKEENDGFYEYI